MERGLIPCRVCGKPHKVCKSAQPSPGIFVWQEVACSPECGNVYLKNLLESYARRSAKRAAKDLPPDAGCAPLEPQTLLNVYETDELDEDVGGDNDEDFDEECEE